MKKFFKTVIDYIVCGFLIALLVAFFSSPVWIVISIHRYEWYIENQNSTSWERMAAYAKEYPEVKPMVINAFKDDVLTATECYNIKKEVEKLKQQQMLIKLINEK